MDVFVFIYVYKVSKMFKQINNLAFKYGHIDLFEIKKTMFKIQMIPDLCHSSMLVIGLITLF